MNSVEKTPQDPAEESFRDHIATVDERGKRVWIYPKKPKGRLTNFRTYISWAFLVFLFGAPFIEVNGEPFLLFDVVHRHFNLFGFAFAPQDFYLFVLSMLTFLVFIVLFTAIWGRLFCGWVCPQTIFMEMVYRKIEYCIEGDANAQRKLHTSPWTPEKMFKKGLKQFLFFSIAVIIANTFLAYIIGYKEVIKIIRDPIAQHWEGFVALILFSYAFYFVFAYLREQVCVAICPYGRLQGVLLDKNSIVVAYDFVRGEPRGKIRKLDQARRSSPITSIQTAVLEDASGIDLLTAEPLAAGRTPMEQVQKSLGDCIDCGLCVQVCPTGIDIRHGTQLECVNCTACIDACDEVMDKVSRPRGLIRYDSYTGIVEKKQKLLTTRVIAYTVVLSLLIVVNILLFATRSDVEILILRTPGMLYQKMENGHISNLYNYEIINKTHNHFPLEFRLVSPGGFIRPIGKIPESKPIDVVEGAFFIEMDRKALHRHKTTLKVEVYSRGKRIGRAKTNFLGPGY